MEHINDVILVGECSSIPNIKILVLSLWKEVEACTGMDLLEVVCGSALEGGVAFGINDPLVTLDLFPIQATPPSIGIQADVNKIISITF